MTFSITVLGSSSALPTSSRFTTAHVLNIYERFFLVDCGEGAQIQLRKLKIPFSKINHIFISHSHGDHLFGLIGLISSYSLLGRTKALHIYGSSNVEEYLNFQTKHFADKLKFEIIFRKIDNNKIERIYEDNNLSVDTFPLDHRIPTNGFLFKEKIRQPNIRKESIEKNKIGFADIVKIKNGEDFVDQNGNTIKNSELIIPPPSPRSYAFCTDTAYNERIIDVIAGSTVLYHEATFMHNLESYAKETKHSTTIQAATIAQKSNVGNLMIGHYSVRYKKTDKLVNEARSVFKNTFGAEDGLNININVDSSINATDIDGNILFSRQP